VFAAPRLALAQGLPGLEARMAERSLGQAGAPVVATEWFSLTCPHCAAFHRDSLPRIRTELVDTGKVRLVFRDFPLDRVALYAAMVSRALPAERYEPFIGALFASQDRWAFNRQANPMDELAKLAALAGMNRESFNAVVADQAFSAAILKGQEEADKTYKVDSTPSFIINGPKAKNRREAGGRTPEDFAKLVAEAAG
jgi:protein-disulfide isomerase